MSLLQPLFCAICNTLYKFTKKINDKIKEKLMIVIIGLISLAFILQSSNIAVSEWKIVVLMVVFMVLSINQKMETIKVNKFFDFIYSAYCICILISILLHSVRSGTIENLCLYLFIFPMIYVIWGHRKDYEVLFSIVSKGIVYCGVVYYIVSILFKPISETTTVDWSGTYLATTTNPNGLGIIALSILLPSLYLFVLERKYKKILYGIMICFSFGLIVLSEARTSLLSALAGIFTWGIYYIIKALKCRKEILKAFIVVGIIVVLFSISAPITKATFSLCAPAEASAFSIGEVAEKIGLEGIADKFKDRSDNKDTFFSGRIELWKYYSQEPTIFGKDHDEFVRKAKKEDHITLGTHNTLIDILVENGYLAAMFFALIEANICIFIFLLIFYKKPLGLEHYGYKKRDNNETMEYYSFVILTAIAYVLAGIVETISHASRFGITMLFFFALTPLVSDNEWQREFDE